MLYTTAITAAKGGSEATASDTRIKCSAGIIHHIDILFPSGCAGLVHVCIYHGGHRFFPSSEGMDVAGDNETVRFKEYQPLRKETNYISVKAWNEDDTYDHTVRVRIGVLPEDVLAFGTLMSRVPNLVRKVLRGRQQTKEEN